MMGDLAYNYLDQTTQGELTSPFSDWLGLPLFSGNTPCNTDSPSPSPVSEQLATDFAISSPSYANNRPLVNCHTHRNYFHRGFPNYFPLTPPAPPSQSPTPECQQPSLPSSNTLSNGQNAASTKGRRGPRVKFNHCHQASPSFDTVRGKWNCDACGKYFHGPYECNRHIQNAGQRAICLICNKEISSRGDSLRRHYSKFCKRMNPGRASRKVKFENAFTLVE